jgi:L-alanine-DL-glutamate epimerase-like enolase superfamily enzyme
MKITNQHFGAAFRERIVNDVTNGRFTINEIAERYNLHPNQVAGWMKEQSYNQNLINRRNFLKNSMAATAGMAATGFAAPDLASATTAPKPTNLRITDLKCAIIGSSPIVRITTNQGISGYGEAEKAKNYLKPYIMFYKDYLINEDPTDVERVMLKIRRLGSFKPWGSAVSAIEMALWDIAGKAAGVPVYKLLGGKIRDKVRVYNGAVRIAMNGQEPEHYAEQAAHTKAAKEGFTIMKMGIGFHSKMASEIPDFFYGQAAVSASPAKSASDAALATKPAPHPNRGSLTEKGLKHIIKCVEAMKNVLGDEIGLALDCGPGHTLSDSIRLARALEPYNLLWLEDLLTGDYYPYVMADVYRELTLATSTPIHTGEQIYLRQNFRELFEQKAIRVVGPDPADIGGIAELKWVAEYADLHGIQMAPHGIFDGLFGLAAHVHAGAAMPENYIAFEYPLGNPSWWYDIVEGLPNPIVKDGHIEVWDRPGLGVEFNVNAAKKYLSAEDKNFFD